MLAAESRQLLRGDGGNGKIRFIEMADDLLEGEHDALSDEDFGDEGIDEEDSYEEDPYEEDREFDGGFDDIDVPRERQQLAWANLARSAQQPRSRKSSRKRKTPGWRQQLAMLEAQSPQREGPFIGQAAWPPTRELLYVIDIAASRGSQHGLHLEILLSDLKKDGTPGKPKARNLPRELLDRLPNADDRRILAVLAGAAEHYTQRDFGYRGSYYYGYDSLPYRYRLLDAQSELILPMISATGRCRLRLEPRDGHPAWLPIGWEEEAEPWVLELEVRRPRKDDHYELAGALRRGAQRMDLAEPVLLASAGILFTREHAARYEHHGSFDWIALLREHGKLRVPAAQRDKLMAALLTRPSLPPLKLPAELRYREIVHAPRPRLAVKPVRDGWRRERLRGHLSFDYDGTIVKHGEPRLRLVQAAERRVLRRDPDAERAAADQLERLGWRWSSPDYAAVGSEPALELAANRLPQVARELVAAGWHVEAEGKPYRAPGRFDIEVSSGVDWFELRGALAFGDSVAQLPDLLAAARRGEPMVRLGDGSFGLLPEEWLARYGPLAGLGTGHDDHVRFERCQIGLLDAFLAAQPEARCDALFARARDKLSRFAGVRAANPPAGFQGELRPYQKEGLGWLGFLREFGFGGCLADDMGLGKTVQVLALLETRRVQRARRTRSDRRGRADSAGKRSSTGIGPSLVVAPKSLIFNWRQEASRFAPKLRVLDHTGQQRRKGIEHFGEHDLILTTYGTLRRDIAHFKDARFDYAILDEAQAIKNAGSASAKAARLLQARHRLALSGTPVENHIGELWSLFEFLNPAMLGTASVFKKAHGKPAHSIDNETRQLLACALRPFLLRRTKEQVIHDLPPKLEQTLYCELEKKQREDYDKLRSYYRASLLKRVERNGIKRAKLQILEALLRLRQAAIHPGLIDKRRAQEPSAKLDMLLHRLQEALDEGHKTLVFSQFTGMLAILRSSLDRLGIAYEYLDGRTRNREQRVARFQTDADCRLFLISLKAGGLGLNLTAAQYVFLLDPWPSASSRTRSSARMTA